MADDNRPFRFLQVSDVLLDARLSFKGLGMSAGKRFERNNEALDAFLRLLKFARRRDVDAVVVTGNLWDGQSVTAATAARLVEAFALLGDIPVVITPGQFDPFTPQSLYSSKVLSAHAIRSWSRNVRIFDEEKYIRWDHPLRPTISFFGRANTGTPARRLLDTASPGVSQRLNVLLDYLPFEQTDDLAIASQQFDFIAFGGCINSLELKMPDGRLHAAAPGSFVGRSVQELGLRTALLTELDFSRKPVKASVERLPADSRRLIPVSVNINGIKSHNVAEHVRKAVEASGARPETDLVYIKIMGIYALGDVPDFGEQQLAKMYYHAKIENAARPDYFLDKADQRTTAGRFIQVLQELKNKAEARGGTLPGTEYGANFTPKDIEDALYYGLDALNQKKVTVPDAD